MNCCFCYFVLHNNVIVVTFQSSFMEYKQNKLFIKKWLYVLCTYIYIEKNNLIKWTYCVHACFYIVLIF